jgi:hypothetical protein
VKQDYKRNIAYHRRVKYGFYQWMDHFVGRERVFKMMGKGRKRFYRNLKKKLEQSGEGQIRPVERVKDLSPKEFYKGYVRTGVPVILDGAAKDWPCVKKWSLEYFKDLHGTDEVVLKDQNDMEGGYEKLTLGDIIDNIRSGGGKYYRFYPLLHHHPEHLKDFDYNWLLERRNGWSMMEAFQVFMGGADTVTTLHNASQCNLFTQVYGEKEWVMYPNYYAAVIDPAPVQNVYRSAPVRTEKGPFDPFNPEYTQSTDLYKYIDGYSVHLKPGDVLWNPPFYWHAVKNKTDSIGVGFRWLPPLYAYKISPLYMFLDLCARNPSFFKSYRLYKEDINLIHMAQYGQLDDYMEEKKVGHTAVG